MPKEAPQNTPHEAAFPDEREDIQRILGYPPGWSLRWGITAVFVAVVLFLGIAWLVKYPDVVTAPVVVVTENPPVRLVARSSGKASRLLVADKQAVEAGQLVLVLENAARLEDVFLLEELAGQLITKAGPEELLDVQLPEGLHLGELQGHYAAFRQAVADLQFFERRRGVLARTASLQQQIRYLEGLNASLEKQEATLAREVEIAERSYRRNQGLLESGAISQLELEQAETNYLQYRRQLENLQSRVLDNKLQVEQFRSEIIALREGRSRERMEKWLAARELLERLDSEIEQWKQTFLVISPIAGQVSLSRIRSPQQFVRANEEVATVVPGAGAGDIVGSAFLPVFNSGKVRTGMRANIRLDGYPYQEFGVLPGKVSNIALVPEENTYLLEISLPDSLTTTYGRRIPFAQELPGQARIITEDRRILERAFDQLISLLIDN